MFNWLKQQIEADIENDLALARIYMIAIDDLTKGKPNKAQQVQTLLSGAEALKRCRS